MLLALDSLTIFGIAVGFGLWIALVYAVYRWGPFEDEQSIVSAFRALTARHPAGEDGEAGPEDRWPRRS